jgi:rubredoxin
MSDEYKFLKKYYDNARLAVDLALALGAKGTDSGNMSNFSEVPPDWYCPCCGRDKRQIARLDKNQNIYCSLHLHHDHFGDEVINRIPDGFFVPNFRESFCRFSDVLVCSDCNIAEPRAKALVGAPTYFSFAPYEIGYFIKVRPNAPHAVDDVKARECYEAAVPAMKLIRQRLFGVLEAQKNDIEDFEHIGSAAWRALKRANEVRKLNAK